MIEPIFTNWTPEDSKKYGKELVLIKHRLHQDPLFSDEALEALMDAYPRQYIDVHTMGANGHDTHTWREGSIGDLTGAQVMEAVRNGFIWVNLRRMHKVSGPYRETLDQIYREINGYVPDLNSYHHNFTAIISSPGVQIYSHADIPGQSLWQIRGLKRAYLYPPHGKFLPQEIIEKIILTKTDEQDIPYEPEFDNEAIIHDMQPGEMAHWELHSPHRIENHDCVNISLTTEHFSTDIRNVYAMHAANGLLRQYAGATTLSTATHGPAFFAKLGLAGIYKKTGIQRARKYKRKIDFQVDPMSTTGFTNIEPYERSLHA